MNRLLFSVLFNFILLSQARSQFQIKSFLGYGYSGLSTENIALLQKGYIVENTNLSGGYNGLITTYRGRLKTQDYNHIQAGLGFRFFPFRRFFFEPRIAVATYQTEYVYNIQSRYDEFMNDFDLEDYLSNTEAVEITRKYTSQFSNVYVSIGFDFGFKIGENGFIKVENYFMQHAGLQLKFMNDIQHPEEIELGLSQTWAEVDLYNTTTVSNSPFYSGGAGTSYPGIGIPNSSDSYSIFTRANAISFEKSIGKRKLSSFSFGIGITSNRASVLSHLLGGRSQNGLKWNTPRYDPMYNFNNYLKTDFFANARLEISLFYKERKVKKKKQSTQEEPVIFY
jgi:hypothetical protein